MRIGPTEIVLIIVLALILFGGSRIAGLGKALGKSIKDFRSEVKTDDPAVVAAPADESETKA
jgi:sec-independent protein translocase protein TatA